MENRDPSTTSLDDAKLAKTPLVSGKFLSKVDGIPQSYVTEYQPIVGSLQYLTHTRPYISFFVNNLCHFLFFEVHWLAVKRLLRYLNVTSLISLCFSKSDKLDIIGNCA